MTKSKTAIIVVISTFIGFFSAVSLSQVEVKQIKFNGLSQIAKSDDTTLINDVIEIVKRDYVDAKNDTDLAESAANGIMSSLDPHSSYLNANSFKEMQVQTKGEFGGVGIEITSELSVIKVVSAIEDTPAFNVGVKSGDYIVKVDGENIYGLSLQDVVKKLRGKPGTKVKVTILRSGEKAPIEKVITREIIKVRAVRAEVFNDVFYVKINTFSQQAYSGLEKELEKVKSKILNKEIKGIVLDLRGNPGGLLDQAIRVSEVFLNKGKVIVSIKGRNIKEKIYQDEEDEKLTANLPVAVLINEGSASASEIVAGALQDNDRAIIMGSKSFGKGSVQTIIPLSDNKGAVRLTTSLYYTPSGKSIQAHGIEPNIELIDAKIEKQTNLNDSESNLRGHIEMQIQDFSGSENSIGDVNLAIYDKDYQLARAIDLVRGVSVYKSSVSK